MDELRPVWPDAPRLVPDAALPPYRFLGDIHPHPRTNPAGSLHGLPTPAPGLPAAKWREDRTYLYGIDLYHQGYLWEAHEQWEAGFFAAAADAHRDLLQALIQLAAALIQAHRGRGAGVRILAGAVVRRLWTVCEAMGSADAAAAAGAVRTGTGAGATDLGATHVGATHPGAAGSVRLAGLDPRALLADVGRHFAPALDASTPDADAARTVGPPPRLDVRPWP